MRLSMASTYSSPPLIHRRTPPQTNTYCKASNTKPSLQPRRQFFFFSLTSVATFAAGKLTAKADDIGLFGIRKRIKEVEKEAEEIVEAAEKEVEAAEEEIENAAGFGGLVQAGVVFGAEMTGVLVASSVVNGILGPEGQKS